MHKLSIRKKLIASILIGCLIPYIIGSMIIKDKTENSLYNENIKDSKLILVQTAELVDNIIINNSKNLASMVASDERVRNAGGDITSYVNFDTKNFKPKNSKIEQEITQYFRSIKTNDEMVNFVSLGTTTGGYIEYPSFHPSAPYDPRNRDWYKNAIDKATTVVSEPYMTKITKDLVVSMNRSVVSKGKRIGVVSLSISLEKIMNKINSYQLGHSGHIIIISPQNAVINSPSNPEWLLKPVNDLKQSMFNDIDKHNGKSFETTIGNVNKVINVYISPSSGWKYLSVVDKSEILQQSRSITGMLYAIYLITILFMIAVIYIISSRITRPILNITKVINKMATFNFDLYESKDFKNYTHQRDEIGEITRAINSMQENYIEFRSNMSNIDKDIQNIDIHKRTVHQLRLSSDNPFASIAYSINELLRKVHTYIEQIRIFNEEISNKNEQLAASEEELKAQLDEIDSQKKYIHFLAEHDPLTNLPNRRMFGEILTTALNSGKSGAVLLLDLDNFKGMNDTLGHLFGDKVLRHISEILEMITDKGVFISRFGGDEFLLLFEMNETNMDVHSLINYLFKVINEKFQIDNIEVKIEFSIGVSMFPQDSKDMNELIMYADLALYHVKNNGKNNFAFFDHSMAEHLKSKQKIKEILKSAIASDGFKLLYQPQVNIQTGEVKGYEALLRLKHHQLSPAEFIAVAEEDSMIIEIGRCVTQMAIQQMAAWKQKGLELRPVSINFSAVQIQDRNYKDYLISLLDQYGISPQDIIIEITESIFLENKDATIVFLEELREKGIKIAIDDFGTGYSSLSYLTFLPIDSIKLDRTLNMKFLELDNLSVMDSLIALAHSLNLKVVAEGIEEHEHVRRLDYAKCDLIQGYYYSKPLEAADVENCYNLIYHRSN